MWRIILILSILLTSITAAGAANDDPFPAVASSYLLAIDGETVWAHRPGKPHQDHTRNRWQDAATMLDRAFMRKRTAPFANGSSVELRGIGNDEEVN